MAKVSFDIPNDVIDKASKKKITQLEKKIKSLEQKLERRDKKLAEIDYEKETEQRAVEAIREFIDKVQYMYPFDDELRQRFERGYY